MVDRLRLTDGAEYVFALYGRLFIAAQNSALLFRRKALCRHGRRVYNGGRGLRGGLFARGFFFGSLLCGFIGGASIVLDLLYIVFKALYVRK